MIPLIEREVVDRHGWMDREEFMDQLALSQSMPGVLAVNMATGVGYRLRGVRGAVVSILGNIMMPIIFILALAIFYRYCSSNPIVEHFFMGMRPAAVALIAVPVFRMAKSAQLTWRTCWVPLAAMLLIWLLGVNPIFVILAAIAAGLLMARLEAKP